MHHLTKGILKRPITVLVTLMALVVFAFVSIKSITMKLTPDMSIPMLAVYTTYPGAAPEEVDELVSKKIESNCEKVSGVKTSQTRSSENVSIVILQFDYGTDLDDAYNDVKKQLDALANEFPDDCQTPLLIEADFESMDDITISVTPTAEGVDVLKAVNDRVDPMLSTMGALAQSTITGGDERYISVELIPEYAQQYGFSIDSICSAITAVNFSMPAGSADYGSQNLSLAAEAKYETIEELEQVPITTSTGKTIHLGDVASIKYAVSDKSAYSRYNGVSNVSIGLKRKNGSTAVDLSNQYKKLLPKLQAENPDLNFDVVFDSADEIISSLKSVAVTLIEAIILSMLVLFIFFGDFKASLIVGSSMPISLLFTFILMGFMDFSLNIVTMNALVIGIGMMVDNAIVVIEMCFRKRDDGLTFMDAAYEGTRLVINSITGSTITTIVVYLPLALMKGLSGQMFKEMGFTIIFAIGSSLISAMTIIPFFFSRFKPVEKKENITNRALRRFAEVYGKILANILRFKKTTVLVVIAIFAVTIMLYSTQDIELLTSTDEGMVEVSMSFRPNLTLEEMDKTVVEMEEFVKNNEYIEKYTTSVTKSSSSASIIAYISKDSKMATDAVVDEWNRQLANFSPSCEVVCTVTSSQGQSMSASAEDEIVLLGEDEEALKTFSEEVYEIIRATDGVINVRSSLTETGSKASVKIDPVMATAKGFSAQQLAGLVYHNMNGKKAMDVDLKDGDYEVTVEFPKDRFKTIADIDTMTFTNSSGASVPLTEMAKVTFESTPSTITRKDGKLECTITATMTKDTSHDVSKIYTEKIDALEFPEGVTRGSSMQDDMMDEELANLVEAVLIAVFLVFMVMAIQFESLINGMLIMLCIPFAFIGSLIFLIIMQVDISMTAIMGVLMLAGIVVNNGIIYVDSTNQMMSNGMEVTDALIETGKSRLRPILMTTLTTILSMVPLAFALAEDSEMMQGMGIVIIGGLIASTILTLTLLPTFYLIVYNIKSRRHPKNKRRLFGLIKPKEMNIAARMDDDPESDDMK